MAATSKYKKYLSYKSELVNTNSESVKTTILNLRDDSLKSKLLLEISYHYLINEDSTNFKLWNSKAQRLSINLNDSTKIGDTYWDLASYWYSKNIIDSAYYNYNKAYNIYSYSGDEFQASRMMLSMAKMQTNIKDYMGSEISTINALKTLIPLNKYEQIYSAYNNLGIVYNELGEYDKSLDFHQKALNIESNLNDNYLKASTFNNMGVVYQNMTDFNTSIKYFNKALLVDSLIQEESSLYAMLLDNLAFSRLKLQDTSHVYSDLKSSLEIRDSINSFSGIIINKLHLVDYFLLINDTISAKKYLKDAKYLSEKYNSLGDLQESLLVLSKIDSENSEKYFLRYIALSDSLHTHERLIRNKFARIRFETDQYISENNNLNERNRNMLWLIVAIIFIFIIIYIIRNQKIRLDKLKLLSHQHLANEEIYNLLLDSQNKLDEGREKEKKRISKELHDGILSKFFGVRLNLEILNDEIDVNSIKERKYYIKGLKELESEIRAVSHKLNEDMSSLDNNFVKILNELFQAQSKIGNFNFNLKIDGNIDWESISNKIKINIYRILQEGLHNINKYSQANLVDLILELKDYKLTITLKDNGVGFSLNSTSGGIGLSNMKSRINDLSGNIILASNNFGTEIKMEIPTKGI